MTGTTDNSISVSWDPPAENPGGRNLTYNVYTSLDGGARVLVTENVPVTSATIMSKYLLLFCMYVGFHLEVGKPIVQCTCTCMQKLNSYMHVPYTCISPYRHLFPFRTLETRRQNETGISGVSTILYGGVLNSLKKFRPRPL